MKAAKKLTGLAIAAAAASLMMSGCATNESGKMEAEVKCSGINGCKGQSACATATSSCSGQNGCKGMGWIKMDKAQCDAKGGTVKG